MKLLIAIPALNEESSIEAIIQRSLAAREHICTHSSVDAVEVTVVSDGSTDRTVELAERYRGEINLIVFVRNRGYGAAIKEAWRQSDAELLGFLDADGTCDPKFFAPLCNHLEREQADVVLGCRLNRESRMPLIRRVGNMLFAAILTAFSSTRVRDTASGMRVVRRSALNQLFPLPDGLHFTPAMSARALMSDGVKIVEIDMPYQERAGESKLRVGKDGLRFLKVILEAAFLYNPARPLGLAAAVLFLAATALMISPMIYYVANRSVLPWSLYRFLVSDVCGIGSCLMFCAAYLTDRIASIALVEEVKGNSRRLVTRFFRGPWFWVAPALSAVIGVSLVLHSVVERLRTGETTEHWSRYVAMSFWLSIALILCVTRIIDVFLLLVGERLNYWKAGFAAVPGPVAPAQGSGSAA